MKKLFFTLLLAAATLPGWADEPTYLTIVGAATSSGWTDNEWQRTVGRMVRTKENTWVWAGQLYNHGSENSEFVIYSDLTGWDNGYWSTVAHQEVGANDVKEFDLSTAKNADNQFKVMSSGMYRITVNTSTKKMKVEKLSAPSKVGDFYLISNVNEFMWYAGYVTSGNNTSKARLTADISFEGKDFFPISCDKHKFRGELDGAGHTVDYAIIDDPSPRVGLCRYLGPGAYIHDIIVGEHSSFTCYAKAGGIAGHARDGGTVTLTNIINKANVTSTGGANGIEGNSAGLIAAATDYTKIIATNCANTGTVSGQDKQCAALAGWTQGGTIFTNCWNIGTVNNQEGSAQLYRNSGEVTAINCYYKSGTTSNQGTSIGESAFGNGELCYKLNGDQTNIGWYQTIGTDAYPVPFSSHSQVYANGILKCDGTSDGDLTYSNSSSSVIPSHNDVNGWCSVCNSFLPNHLIVDSEGFYGIGNAADLNWFATLVKTTNQSAKAKLTADIDYTDYKNGWIGTSQSAPFRGTFDGQEHTITIDIVNNGLSRTGLFAYINAATIKNLIVEGSATSAGNNCVGGLGGRSDSNGTLIENVIVKTAVSYTGSSGDATCGGFFANMEASATLRNCAFLGSISAGTKTGNGGLVGWCGGGSNITFENCLIAPAEISWNGGAIVGRNTPTVTNCYYYNISNNGDFGWAAGSSLNSATVQQIGSGETCYKLNAGGDNWYQTLSGTVDATPVPFSSHKKVYRSGSEGSYTYANATLIQIGTAQELIAFATEINNGNKPLNTDVELTNDINMSGQSWTPIGSDESHKYVGVFDGKHHKITNLTIDLNQDNVGVFGVIGEGATIKNFTLDSSCSIKGKAHVGIIGMAKRTSTGNIYLECLGNEANVNGTTNIGGILGVNMNNNGYAKLYMTNCYTTGAIKGNSENGQLTGWSGNNAVVENCYAIGTVTNCDGFGRLGSGSTSTNCYCDKDIDWGPAKITNEMLTSGELAYKLGSAFTQDLSQEGHPTFASKEVKAGKWFNYASNDVYYNQEGSNITVYQLNLDETKSKYDVPANVTAKNVSIARNIPADKWIGLCLPFDYDIPEGWDVRKLIGVSGSGEEASMKFSTASTIEAGKPYIVNPEATVTTITATDKTIATGSTNVTFGGVTMVGNLNQTSISQGNFYINTSSQLKKLTAASATLKGFRAYFTVNGGNGVKALSFDFDDDATGISLMEDGRSQMEDGAIYNVAGQRLNKMQKGINIVNGKKILK